MSDEQTIDKLKPCPICKGNNLSCDYSLVCNETQKDWYVLCRDCDIQIHAGNEECVIGDWNILPRQELSELEREVLRNVLVQPDDNCEYSVITVPWIEREDGTDVYTIQILSRKKAPVWKVGDGFEDHDELYILVDHDGTNWAYSRLDSNMDGLSYFSVVPERHKHIPNAELLQKAATRALEV